MTVIYLITSISFVSEGKHFLQISEKFSNKIKTLVYYILSTL